MLGDMSDPQPSRWKIKTDEICNCAKSARRQRLVYSSFSLKSSYCVLEKHYNFSIFSAHIELQFEIFPMILTISAHMFPLFI